MIITNDKVTFVNGNNPIVITKDDQIMIKFEGREYKDSLISGSFRKIKYAAENGYNEQVNSIYTGLRGLSCYDEDGKELLAAINYEEGFFRTYGKIIGPDEFIQIFKEWLHNQNVIIEE